MMQTAMKSVKDKFIVIRQRVVNNNTDDWHFYNIANQIVCAQGRFDALLPFEIGTLPDVDNVLCSYIKNDFCLLSSSNTNKLYESKTAFLQGDKHIRCLQKKNIVQINIGHRPVCIFDLENQVIQNLSNDDFNSALNTELLLGPALIMLLARRGIFCLHAGAAMTENGLVIFIGESGVGKSTMAKTNGDDWVRVCDDVLPLKLYDDNRLVALPGFAQLKLTDAEQHNLDKYQEIPVQTIFRISRPPDNAQASIIKKQKKSAILELVRHTVASKMFTSDLLEEHMRFCKQVLDTKDIYELSYPRELDKLEKLQKKLSKFTGTLTDVRV